MSSLSKAGYIWVFRNVNNYPDAIAPKGEVLFSETQVQACSEAILKYKHFRFNRGIIITNPVQPALVQEVTGLRFSRSIRDRVSPKRKSLIRQEFLEVHSSFLSGERLAQTTQNDLREWSASWI